MRGNSVTFVHKIVVILLTLNYVHSNSWPWNTQAHQNYFNYGNSDDQSSTFDDYGNSAPRNPWRWPSYQQSIMKMARSPLGRWRENEKLSNDKFIFPDMEPQTPFPVWELYYPPSEMIESESTESRDRLSKIDVHASIKFGEAPACKGSTFCEEVPNYPTSFVNNVVKNRNLGTYESVDAMDITYRLGTDDTETLCVATEQIVYPKTAESVNKQWLFIVNHPNFTQGVRVETCMKEGKQCNIIAGFAEGYATTCEQKYIYRQLAAISESGLISQELFRFPASCCCQVEFLGTSLGLRFGRSIGSQKKRT